MATGRRQGEIFRKALPVTFYREGPARGVSRGAPAAPRRAESRFARAARGGEAAAAADARRRRRGFRRRGAGSRGAARADRPHARRAPKHVHRRRRGPSSKSSLTSRALAARRRFGLVVGDGSKRLSAVSTVLLRLSSDISAEGTALCFHVEAARRRVFWWGLAPGGCRAALRGAAASPRPRGLRDARLWWPTFSPSFLHTPKVTTVPLSFSYGEWNFGLLFVSLGRGDGAGRGVELCFSGKNICQRPLSLAWAVLEVLCVIGVVHEDHGARGTGRARVGARSSNFEGRGQPYKQRQNNTSASARARGSPHEHKRIAAAPRGSERNARAPTHQKWAPAGVERRSTSAANAAH